jgi:lipoprotein-anchoring transpeptidase ErfK/SrfK
MLRLRELAGAAALGIAAMSAAVSLPVVSNVHVTLRPDYIRLASLNMALGGGAQAAPAPQMPVADPLAAQVADASDRLKAKIPNVLYQYFDVYLYVSKAAAGSLAQHMYVFHKDASDNLVFEQTFAVSTGRERHEKYYTDTPDGLFQLDPDRFERMHYSHTWGGAPMPYAMFLDATIHGRQTGVALHSASVHTAELGNRASGGCVRLPPEKAQELFERFRADEQGTVPVFAFDHAHNRTSGDGVLQRDVYGHPLMVQGYRVLVFIEDYPGGPAFVAVVA